MRRVCDSAAMRSFVASLRAGATLHVAFKLNAAWIVEHERTTAVTMGRVWPLILRGYVQRSPPESPPAWIESSPNWNTAPTPNATRKERDLCPSYFNFARISM